MDISNKNIIITGAGRGMGKKFAVDLKELGGETSDKSPLDMDDVDVARALAGVRVPIIAAINGYAITGGFELALMCDITICADKAIIVDPHLDLGLVPGDGIHSAFIELLGVKRAAYALLTCEIFDAQKCLDYGLVNEVVPRDKLDARAWEIAERIMARKRTTRRMSVPVVRRPWKQRIADDLDGGFAMEMHAYMCDSPEHRDDIGRQQYERMEGLTEADRKKGVRTTTA